VRDVRKAGYRTAILEELKVWHAGSPYYSRPSRAKVEFHDHRKRANARKELAKRIILRLPFAAALNERYGWIAPPERYEPPVFERRYPD
jgi:GT2 family glycosyltransferase